MGKIYLELPEPAAADNLPDASRLIQALQQQHHEHRLTMDLDVIRTLPDILREAEFKVTVSLLRPVQPERKSRIIDISPGDQTTTHYAMAVDIGHDHRPGAPDRFDQR